MARPHPVVGLSAEFTHGCGRSPDETNVPVGLVDDEILDIVIVEVFQNGAGVGVVFLGGLADGFSGLPDGLCYLVFEVLAAFELFPGLFFSFFDDGGHVGHAYEEGDGKAGDRKFLALVHCPVAVLEIVVFIGGKALDAAVAAMVVGYEKAVLGDHLSGAAASELDDRILEGRMVDAVDLVGGKPAPELDQLF